MQTLHEIPQQPFETNTVELVGPIRDEPNRQAIQDYVESAERANAVYSVIPHELEQSPEQEKGFGEIVNATERYMHRKLGLTTGFKPTPDRFHILEPQDFADLRTRLGEEDHGLEIVGFPLSNGDLVMNGKFGPEYMMHVGQHEYLHKLSGGPFRLHKVGEGYDARQTRGGLHVKKTSAFIQLEEFVTEKTNQEIIAQEWPKTEVLSTTPPIPRAGHANAMKYGDALLQKMSEELDESPEKLFKQLQMGTYAGTGDMKVIRRIQEVVGNQHVRELAYATFTDLGRLTLELQNQK